MMYGCWDMEHDGQNFLSYWTGFCPIYCPNSLKHKNFKKWKKIACDEGNCHFSSWAIFCSLNSLTVQETKISKSVKNPEDIIIFYYCTKNHDHMLYCFQKSRKIKIAYHCLIYYVLVSCFNATWENPLRKKWKMDPISQINIR